MVEILSEEYGWLMRMNLMLLNYCSRLGNFVFQSRPKGTTRNDEVRALAILENPHDH